MKKFLLLIALSGFAIAANMHFEKNQKCSECHPAIYKEYKQSQHGKATVFEDPIHGAVYDLHPMKWKQEKYRCGACHVPTADNLSELLKANNGVIPDADNETQNGINRFYNNMEFPILGLGNDYYGDYFDVDIEDGKLIVFPGNLGHSALPYYGNKDRIVISFNTEITDKKMLDSNESK